MLVRTHAQFILHGRGREECVLFFAPIKRQRSGFAISESSPYFRTNFCGMDNVLSHLIVFAEALD